MWPQEGLLSLYSNKILSETPENPAIPKINTEMLYFHTNKTKSTKQKKYNDIIDFFLHLSALESL